MLLVIFGAGASFDSAPLYPDTSINAPNPRLPLANDLFSRNPINLEAIEKFPACQPIFPYLHNAPNTVENWLEKLRNEAERYPQRNIQLAAIRYYLQHVIFRRQQSMESHYIHNVSNYTTLIDQINYSRNSNGKVAIVTFNYDTLIETALKSVDLSLDSIHSYITNPHWKLFKLHGSVNWGREIHSQLHRNPSDEKLMDEIISTIHNLDITNIYKIINYNQSTRIYSLFPAIAIPYEEKREFECPDEHVTELKRLIPHVTKVVSIGWRAADRSLLELIHEHQKDQLKLKWLVIGKNQEDARSIIAALERSGVSAEYQAGNSSFTNVVVNRLLNEFLEDAFDEDV